MALAQWLLLGASCLLVVAHATMSVDPWMPLHRPMSKLSAGAARLQQMPRATVASDANSVFRVHLRRRITTDVEENPLLHEFAAEDFATITNEVDDMPPLEEEEEEHPCSSERLRRILELSISSSPRASLFRILRRIPHAQFGINCTLADDIRPQLRLRANFCQLTQYGTTCALAVGPLRPPFIFDFHLSEAQIFRPDMPNTSQDARPETDVARSKLLITRPKKRANGVTPEAEELSEILATIGPEPIPSHKFRSEGEAR